MSTHADIVERYVAEAGKQAPNLPRSTRGNVFVHPADTRELVSYGTHFTLARIMLDDQGNRSWWLLNGDTYSVSTTRHQGLVRDACHRSGLPVMIVPFTVLGAAGIAPDSIEPVEITSDRFDWTTHHADDLAEVPRTWRSSARQTADGCWTWDTARHRLGESLFRAAYTHGVDRETGRRLTGSAYFLSAFDHQESRPHYFLCELPAKAVPSSVAEAFEALKPAPVIEAEAACTVTRQGDVFAVPVELTTRQVHKRGKSQRRGVLLDLSHEASEVVQADDGTTYARGCLHHAPVGWDRVPEHRRQRMGDGRQWHVIVKNTVPVDHRGDSRAWSRAGNVD